ncbi:hypothetical protein NTGM5_70012 [Candidatus Nitrotoga sp. M5]|nr:hypothetical protein NTGM5_70012 [Candidatus Nitrotoga sp. M5]
MSAVDTHFRLFHDVSEFNLLLLCNIPATIILSSLQSSIRSSSDFNSAQAEHKNMLFTAISDSHTTRDTYATRKFWFCAKNTVIQDSCALQTDYK